MFPIIGFFLTIGCFRTVVLEKTLESPLDFKEIQPVHAKGNQSWIFFGRTDAEAETPVLRITWLEELTGWKRPWYWERLKAAGEGDDRGWDDWMASLTRWTWVWVRSGNWWCIGKPGVLQSMESQRVGHNCVTELNWTDFDDGHSDRCDVVPLCSFDLHFSNNELRWASFHVFISHLYVFFGKMSV